MIVKITDCFGNDVDLERVEFKNLGRVHEWRNYVPDGFRKIWKGLPIEARLCLFIMASNKAEDEDWD